MEDNRIIVLLTRKVAGELSDMESRELDLLLQNHPDAVYYDEFLKELWKQQAPIAASSMDYFYSRHKRRHDGRFKFGMPEAPAKAGYVTANNIHKKRWVGIGVLGLLVFAFLSPFLLRSNHPKKEDETRVTIVSGHGMKKQLTLPDGTSVWLNADSRISFSSFDKAATRFVYLEGEAYFDVFKDKRKPFIIKTDKISIKVLGTSFNVKAYEKDKVTETTLLKGAIELSVNERPQEKYVLKPSEKLAVMEENENRRTHQKNAATITLAISNIDKVQVGNKEYVREISWMDNKMMFNNETMEEIIPKLERWYHIQILVKNPALKQFRFTGTITQENLQQALKAMQLIKPFNYKIEKNDVTIY